MLHSNPRYDRGGSNQAPARPPERCHPQGPGAHKWFAIQNLRPSSRPHHVLMHRPAPIRALCLRDATHLRQTSPKRPFFQFPFQRDLDIHSTSLPQTFCLGAAPQQSSLRLIHRMGRQQRGPNVDTVFPPPIKFWALLAVSLTPPCPSAKPLRSSCF